MVTNTSDIYAKIVALIADQLSIDKSAIELNSRLETLGADSLDQVEIVMKLEEEFDIEINDHDAEELVTVGDVTNYVAKLLQKRA
ncbi:acyl carrier protein [Candidatus Dependentiae bacterium]|nr:acyl carrier protein [Candidatus Dependentiae bacterium]